MFDTVWGKKWAIFKPRNDNGQDDANWLNAKAYEHLRLYETLYAQAHAIDMACRHAYAKGVQS